MDDLISRKAAIELLGEPHPLDYNAISNIQKIISLPSIQAVPLDKLCEWLVKRVYYLWQIIEDCHAFSTPYCIGHDEDKVACWKKLITKWMEES